MAGFHFRLESLLKYRLYRRDVLQSLYASILQRKDELLAQRDELHRDRERQFEEMREFVGFGSVDVDAAAARRYHAGRIHAELAVQANSLDEVQQQLKLCRRELTAAEQDVQAIEKLKAKQQSRFEYEQNRRTQHELEDNWSAARAGERALP